MRTYSCTVVMYRLKHQTRLVLSGDTGKLAILDVPVFGRQNIHDLTRSCVKRESNNCKNRGLSICVPFGFQILKRSPEVLQA